MSADPVLTPERLSDLAGVPAVSRWVRIDDLTLHVLDYGGTQPPLLVLPGITTPAVGWDFVAQELVDVVRPLVLDIRGRGLSSRASSHRNDEYAADVEAIWSDLSLGEGFVLGHSMGARAAAVVNIRGNVPLLGTLFVDPPLSGPKRGPYPTSLENFQAQLDSARSGLTANDVAKVYPAWPRRELELRARWLATCDDTAVIESHGWFEREDFFDIWPDVAPPAAFIYGAVSPVVTAEGAEEAALVNSGANIAAIPDAGHMIPWDNMLGFLDVVRSFIGEVLEPRSATGSNRTATSEARS
jgi:N-formylmaleamate deformylase